MHTIRPSVGDVWRWALVYTSPEVIDVRIESIVEEKDTSTGLSVKTWGVIVHSYDLIKFKIGQRNIWHFDEMYNHSWKLISKGKHRDIYDVLRDLLVKE